MLLMFKLCYCRDASKGPPKVPPKPQKIINLPKSKQQRLGALLRRQVETAEKQVKHLVLEMARLQRQLK